AAAGAAIHAGGRHGEGHAAELHLGGDAGAGPALVRTPRRSGEKPAPTGGNRALRRPYASTPGQRRPGDVLARSTLNGGKTCPRGRRRKRPSRNAFAVSGIRNAEA